MAKEHCHSTWSGEGAMKIEVAIVLAGLIIAAGVMVGGRYHGVTGTLNTIWRVDSWTGKVDLCFYRVPPEPCLSISN